MAKPELLAPAGDYKSFIAAVEAGADAVYFGGKYFSARNLAINLTDEEVKKAVDYAHLRHVKCYAAVNTLIKDREFADLFGFINFLYAEGIDALIVQDLGVFNFCQKYWPDLPLHASTQMTAHNSNDVLVLQKMGFKRAVLARELTLEEIYEIKNISKIEMECFAHGALCFSYSSQCLLSSMIGGRSGNRGRCAQPCRKKYSIIDFKKKENSEIEGYLLSTKDLCALDILDKMRCIDSIKIEGRMKGAAYVGGVVEKYRKAIDSLAKNKKISSQEMEADKKELAALFNRGGFSHGYCLEKKPADLIASERSKNFGIRVGEVVSAKNGFVKIVAERVNVNDGLEIWGRSGQEKNAGFRVEKISGNIIEGKFEGDIQAGDPVYKNFDYNLNKKLLLLAQENYQKRIPVRINFFAREGKNISLEMNGVKVEGGKAEKAEKIQTGEKAISEQLAKLGGTPFFAEKINIDISGEINIPLKDLNAVRREAALKLEKKIIDSFKRQEKKRGTLNAAEGIGAAGRKDSKEGGGSKKRICIQSDSPVVLDYLLDKEIFRIYTSLCGDTEKFRKKGIEVFQILPKILRKGEEVKIFAKVDGYLAPAIGYLEILPKNAKKMADYSMNIFNSFSADQIKNLGFAGFTSSVENTLEEINAIAPDGMEKEVIVCGRIPVMTSEHCVFYKTKHCRQKDLGIKDEKQIIFPVLTDCANCRMQVLNSSPLYFTEIGGLTADNIRLIHTIESPAEFFKKIESYMNNSFQDKKNTTTGHFYRSVE